MAGSWSTQNEAADLPVFSRVEFSSPLPIQRVRTKTQREVLENLTGTSLDFG